jgi:tetratricopeptide (TPR) repeat protein
VALQLDFDFPRAVRELTAAAQGMPSNVTAFTRLAQAQAYNRDLEGSVASYEKALALDPNGLYFSDALVSGYIALGRFDEARALARRMAAQNPGSYPAVRKPAQVELKATGDLSPLFALVRNTGDGFRASSESTADRWLAEIAAGDPTAALAVLDSAVEAARPDLFYMMRAETLRRLGRGAEAAQLLGAMRVFLEKQLAAPRDPFIEALTRVQLGFVQARLGDAAAARANAAAADRLWGVDRDPSDGADVWFGIAVVLVAVGDVDAALDKLTWLADNRTALTAGRQWTDPLLVSLHADPRFRALMQKHGVDVTREPFAENAK